MLKLKFMVKLSQPTIQNATSSIRRVRQDNKHSCLTTIADSSGYFSIHLCPKSPSPINIYCSYVTTPLQRTVLQTNLWKNFYKLKIWRTYEVFEFLILIELIRHLESESPYFLPLKECVPSPYTIQKS